MASTSDGLRQRTAKGPSAESDGQHQDASNEDELPSRTLSFADILRVIVTLLGLLGGISYYLTSGDSLLFGYKPWFTRPGPLAVWLRGPLSLTDDQLTLFNGTDPNMPIYLAINGTIFDVTDGRRSYGPGGGYSVFAGRDATRAFVTGCFLEDRTSDLRGAEEIFLPIEDPDEVISSGARKKRVEKERRDAKKRVIQEVRQWENFYQNHKTYFAVGKLVGVEEHKGEPPALCESASKGRPKRKEMNKKKDAPGKPVQ